MRLCDNIRYRELSIEDGVFVPDVGIDYPEDDPLARLIPVNKQVDLKFDSGYPFLDDSIGFRTRRSIAYFLVFFVLFLANKLLYGIRYEGRSVLWRHRKEFRNGIISVSNHVYRWDGAAVAQALHHRLWVPMLSEHFEGPDRWNLKYFGGIPLPDESYGANKKFNEAFDTHHRRREWIHVFSEARNWQFYKPVRPFQKGAFTMAYKYDAPVLPICISYRQRKGIYRLFGPQQAPLLTVRIGEPVFPDLSQPRKAEVERLLRETHASICRLGGITGNSWPAIWENEKGGSV